MFAKPENTVDVSKCLANLSSFAARSMKKFHIVATIGGKNSQRYYKMLIAVWLGSNLH